MSVAILLTTIVICLMVGVPVGISLAVALLALLAYNPVTTTEFVSQAMYSGVASFSMMALPFFILAGSIMDLGGISKRLVNFAGSLVGNVTGGLGMVAIVSCFLFGAISGSSPATVAAIGSIMIPQMVKGGYDKYYATGLIAVAGGLGIIVPPSYPLVIYGITNNVSISKLFIAGIGPAIVLALILMVFNYFLSKKYGYIGTGVKFSLKNIAKTLWDAKLALLMPVIILGGIYSGVFTATEASVVSCVYGIIIGVFVYKELSWKNVWKMYRDNVAFLGGMLFVFAPAAAMGPVFAYLGVTRAINSFFLGLTTNAIMGMLILLALLFIIGIFLETTPTIVIFSPLLVSIANGYGINPIHFGIVMDLCLIVAFISPPVACNLFVASTLSGLNSDRIVKAAIPFIIALIICVFVIAYIPQFPYLSLIYSVYGIK